LSRTAPPLSLGFTNRVGDDAPVGRVTVGQLNVQGRNVPTANDAWSVCFTPSSEEGFPNGRRCQEWILLTRRAEKLSDYRVLKVSCSRATARVDEDSDRNAATICIWVDIGGEVVARPAATVTVVPAIP
jgi:hypothetical protein